MNISRYSLSVFMCTTVLLTNTTGASWWSSLFHSKKHHKIVHKEYDLPSQEKLIIHNINGSISIKTNWQHQKVALSATIKGSSPEELHAVQIADRRSKGALELHSTTKDPAMHAVIDYELIVPSNLALELTTKNGNIYLKQVTKPTLVTTQNGSIDIYKAQHSVIAHCVETGSITIEHAQNTVKAVTAQGDISISDAHQSVVAHTKKGNIALAAHKVPSTAKIELMSNAGNITIDLPPDVNADVQAHTKKGLVTCQHYITLKPCTMQLTDKHSYDRFKREVEGTIGSGEAQIFVSALKGNIAIEETHASKKARLS